MAREPRRSPCHFQYPVSMRPRLAIRLLPAVLSAFLFSAPWVSASAQTTPESLEPAVLSLEDISSVTGAEGSLSLFENPSFPNRCLERSPGRYTCSRNMRIAPHGVPYPYFLHIESFSRSADAEWEFKLVKSYRPQQDGVVGVPRDDNDVFSVAYVHAWDAESVFTIQRRGSFLASASCSANKGKSSLARLQSCAESLTAAQIQRMEMILGQGLRVPDQPISVSATLDGTTARLSWSNPTSDGGSPITSFEVRDGAGTVVCRTPPSTAGLGECQATVSDLGAQHTFRVVAINAVGASPASDSATPIVVERRINPPRAVRVVSKGTDAIVSWRASKQAVMSVPTVFTATVLPGGEVCTTRSTRCVVRNLEPGGTFVVRVTARQGDAVSKPTQGQRFSTRPTPAPTPSGQPQLPAPLPEPPKQELQIN